MAVSTNYWIISALLVTNLFLKSAHPACTVEENKDAVMTCIVDVGDSCIDPNNPLKTLLRWTVGDDPNYWTSVINCFKDGCPDIDSYTATFTGSGTVYTSSLTISNISLSSQLNRQDTWQCVTSEDCGNKRNITCSPLEIYVLPESPTCSTFEIRDENGTLSSIQVNISTSKVYPAADCKYYRSTNEDIHIRDITGVEVSSFGDPVYYGYQCETIYSLSDLGEGNHTFESLMYPRVSGGDSVSGLENITCGDRPISLEFPKCSITCDQEPKEGYFRGTSTTCTCDLADAGYPAGTVQWVGVDTLNDDGSITLSNANMGTEYTCKPISALGEGQPCTIVSNFARLDADSVEVVTPDLTLCLSDNDETTVTCQVSKRSANPGVFMSFSVDGITFSESQAAVDNESYYKSEFNFTLDQTGEYQITCRAVNSIYSDMVDNGTSVSNISVIEISSVSMTNNGTAELSVGQTVSLTCEAMGYPTPFVTIYKEGDDTRRAPTGSGRVQYNISSVTCDDLGRFICTASNAGCGNISETDEVNIFCPPKLKNKAEEEQSYKVVLGENRTFHTTIKSYPPVEKT